MRYWGLNPGTLGFIILHKYKTSYIYTIELLEWVPFPKENKKVLTITDFLNI